MAFIPDSSVAIILVNWNGYAFTAACLSSLRAVDYPEFTVFLVDNASTDSEGSLLKRNFPEIELIQNTENLGFAGGNNVGIRKALDDGYAHVLLLNNDTIVEADFLGQLMRKFINQPKLAVVQPLIFFLHDRDQIWSAGGKWNNLFCRAITLGDRKFRGNFPVKDKSLDWATGCCMLITREALAEVGLLNESYFTYFEDVEWSLRFRDKGYEIALASESVIYHEAGASSKKKHSEGTLSAGVFYYLVRNQFYLIRTRGNAIEKVFSGTYHTFRFVGWMVYFCLRGRSQKLKAVAKGIRDGWKLPLQNAPQWR